MMQQQMNQKNALDAQLVNAVIGATTEVLGTMAQTQVSYKSVNAQGDYMPSGDLSAVIGISGQHGEGMFALSFNLDLASLIVSRLLGIDQKSISSEDRCDGVGELVNMISGSVKRVLSQHSGEIYKLSLPTVVQGSDHTISSRPKNNPYLVVLFEAEGQTFTLQVSFKNDKDQ